MFPTADQIAIALVAAARALNEDPIAVARGVAGVRSRHVALGALVAAFPDARRVGLARCLGYPTPPSAQAAVIHAKKARWWNELLVDEIVGALVAEQYGDRAA